MMAVMQENIEVHGATLWTARQGSGPALVLCHGGPGLWDYLAPVAAMVEDLVTVYRYDQRACGRSSGGPPHDVTTTIADLEALRAHWGLTEWIVAGHSWGASLALLYCLAYPARARGLIYLSGTGIDPAWHAEYKANQAARLGPQGQARMAALRARQVHAAGADYTALEREMCALAWATDFGDWTHAYERARQLFVADLLPNHEVNRQLGADAGRWVEHEAMAARLADMDTPTLIVHGEADLRPIWAARRLAGSIPHARLRTLPAVGHLPWLEQPDQFGAILREFITALPPGASGIQ
jgi:proline iminopeptidase